MKTIKEKYKAVLEGNYSKSQFVRDAKRELSQFLSPYSQFDDSVQILKSKGILSEVKKEATTLEYECPVSKYSDEAVRRGCDYELTKKGIDPVNATAEEKTACEKVAIKNLDKDEMHYLNIMAGESKKVDKHDKMVEPNEKNKVDTFNGMKKAELKEETIKESYDANDDYDNMDFSKLNPGQKAAIDVWLEQYAEGYFDNKAEFQGMIDKFAEIENANDLEDFVHADFSGDEGERQWFIRQLEKAYLDDDQPLDEEEAVTEINQEEYNGDFIIKHYTNPKNGKSLIDDEIIGDFFKTHPESKEQTPEDALDNFENFLLANYEMPGDYMQEKVAKTVDDVIDPAEYGMIGQGYLKGFNRPHSLDLDDLEVLGRKVVQSLYKGDFDKAKAKFITPDTEMDEQMSDEEMAKIAKYGKDTDMKAIDKLYQLGDKFSSDFDYDGMLKAGLKLKISTPVSKMQQVYDSFEDVNYHSENGHLGNAIDYVKDGDKAGALKHLKLFRDAIRKTLSDISEGHCNTHRKKNEEVVTESRGAFDLCIQGIKDIAVDGDISEREAAMEMMIAISDRYDFDLAGLETQLFDGDDAINEGRRAKSKGGKVVTENDYETGGYVEAMGPMFERAVNMLISAWEEWKMGPMTEPGMIEHAKRDIVNYVEMQLMVDNLEEKKGKDHDGDGDIDGDDYMAGKDKAIKKAMGKNKIVKENIKAIISKVLEEGVVNEAATNALANFSETYGGFEGMKQAIIALQDLVTDIESYYDKTRGKIQKVYDTLGDIRNEEGLKVGGFLAPAIEQAFNKDLRPAIKGGFTKGLDQPKVKMITQRDIDMHNSGEKALGEEEKETVYSRPSVNGTLQENKKNKK